MSVGVRRHTQDVCGCPCVSVNTHRTSVPTSGSVHTGRPWVSASTHRTSVSVCVCPCVSNCVGKHTQDVRGLHTGRSWVSASTHRPSVAVRQHTQDVYGCPCVSVCVRVTLALPMDCLGDFGPRGLSVQYTQDVCGCLPAHIGRLPWLLVCIRVCPCVSVSTHRTSVAVHQYTYQHAGSWTQHAGPSRGLFG
ncbi:unnamed protein product [Brassica rapa]|uniref:Uncharacterized protein n=1 Tax=Brassica campestris TaxID=3711 RepID=A0A8D9DCE5_BRACM|nr:unnamed protein product [Brassica rapa]